MSTKSEKVVRSILQSEFKKPIEDIVQIRSNVQALGNLVFTKAILLAAECESLPDEIVTQSFINACQRAVCSRERGQCPKQVKYIKRQCETFLQEAQKRVNSRIQCTYMNCTYTETRSA